MSYEYENESDDTIFVYNISATCIKKYNLLTLYIKGKFKFFSANRKSYECENEFHITTSLQDTLIVQYVSNMLLIVAEGNVPTIWILPLYKGNSSIFGK